MRRAFCRRPVAGHSHGDQASPNGPSLFSLRQSLEVLYCLTYRELGSRFRGSYLGWLWALVRPLMMLLIYGLIVGVFLGAARSIPEFMIFIFVGLICWNMFSSIITNSIASVVASGPLISRNRFPRILLPLAGTGTALVDSAVSGAVLIIGYFIVSDWPSSSSLLYLIPAGVGVVFLALALGLILSAINVYVRDVGYLTDVALQVGFWLCPILYSYGFIVRAAEAYGWSVEWVTRIYMLNPMANGVLGFQRALWPPASTPEGADFSFPGQLEWRLAIFVVISAALLALAVVLFNRLSRNFAEEL
jgi:ABC-2 type transport system permease protein